MATATSVFGRIFGGNNNPQATPNGGIAHNTNGRTMVPQQANPAQQVQTGQATVPAAQTETPPDPVHSQLAEMAQVWQTPLGADGKPVQVAPPTDPLQQPIFTFKPEEVRKSADSLSFTQGLNPELAQKALGGDADALTQLLEGVGRNVWAMSTVNAGTMINNAGAATAQRIDQSLPNKLRSHAIQTSQSQDPILQSDALKPMVAVMKQAIAMQHPHLSPEQVQQVAEEYFHGVGKVYGVKEQQTAAKKEEEGQTNWMKFMGLE